MILAVENAILAHLTANFSAWQVEAYPQDPAQYLLTHPDGAILVRYVGSEYRKDLYEYGGDKATSLAEIPAIRKMTFEFTLLVRDLTSHAGAYNLIDQLLDQVTGLDPAGVGELIPLKDEFIQEVDGVWTYSIKFQTFHP